MRSRVAWSVREKNAKCTPKPASSYVSGPAWASRSANRSLPSAVILYTTRPRRLVSGGIIVAVGDLGLGDPAGRLQRSAWGRASRS